MGANDSGALRAYLLTRGSLILIGGSVGDIYGERRVFTIAPRSRQDVDPQHVADEDYTMWGAHFTDELLGE